MAVMGYLVWSVFGIRQLSPSHPSHYLVYASMYLVLVIGADGFYLPFEANTARVRRLLKLQLLTCAGVVQTHPLGVDRQPYRRGAWINSADML